MILADAPSLGTSIRVLEPEDAFPELPDEIEELFLDVETTPFDPERPAFFPHLGDRICGLALTWDDHPHAYYFPIRHKNYPDNLSIDLVVEYFRKVFSRSKLWINHNVKFDAHFMRYEGVDVSDYPNISLVCTLVLAKLIDSDRSTHSLKPLSRHWLKLDMEEEVVIKTYLRSAKSQDYAVVPPDILGAYAGMDVLANRKLYRFILEAIGRIQERSPSVNGVPSRFSTLVEEEIALTPVLYGLEKEGIRCERKSVQIELAKTLHRLMKYHEELRELTGAEFVDSNKVMYDIIVTKLGLPIVSWNENEADDGTVTRTASFDKDALQLYTIHREVIADPEKERIIGLILKYRTEDTFRSLFLETYLNLSNSDGELHPSFNQCVRTGRMSCSTPNGQQLNKRAKGLIIPKRDEAFLSVDASQLEFRWIGEYIGDEQVIQAYLDNPRTDFHEWVAELAGLDRKKGKIMNFSVAFGAGEKKVTSELSADKGIAEGCPPEIREDREAFISYCVREAKRIYRTYHEALPGIKRTSELAKRIAKERGFVVNRFGRIRRLHPYAARKAFNSVIQGTAADYVKSVMRRLHHADILRKNRIRMLLQVHDAILFTGSPKLLSDLDFVYELNRDYLEPCPVPCRIPMKWDSGFSEISWAHADSKENKLDIP